MCRWAAWSGAAVALEDIISRPGHSLVHQSRNASECKAGTNADGFGVAWYGDHAEPGLYKDVRPAWSDPNLHHLARQVRSRLFLAHVRASTGTATSYNNCHPFAVGRWSFMHNGQVGGFDAIRKAADMSIADTYYGDRKGATDSEALFLMALGFGLDAAPVAAMSQAVGALEDLSRTTGSTPHMRLTACWSDGHRLFAARYASDEHAPSLYLRRSATGVMVVSEPLDPQASGWEPVAAGTCVEVADGRVALHDFRPQSGVSDQARVA